MSKISNAQKVMAVVEAHGFIDTQLAFLHLGMSGGTLTKVLSDLRRSQVKVRRYTEVNPFNAVRTSKYFVG
jgi:hypothetical protein